MLLPEAVDDWFGDHLSADQRIQLLLSFADAITEELEFYEVTHAVDASVAEGQPNNNPEFIQPMGEVQGK